MLRGFLRAQRTRLIVYVTLLLLIVGYWQRTALYHALAPVHGPPRRTVAEVLEQHGPAARAELEPRCRARGIGWPPRRVALLVFKKERVLEVWVAGEAGPYSLIKEYRVFGASGDLGPKRRRGDGQVPEGFYAVEGLNPNSQHHLSIKVSYPNREDRDHAAVPAEDLGGDIFIHGGAASAGCVAIGDKAIEEVFSLVAEVPAAGRRVIISPVDFRRGASARADVPWVTDLYARLAMELAQFPPPSLGSP
ncbi:MAG: L,D-transpeptidase family protein [Myxococcales bacterium]